MFAPMCHRFVHAMPRRALLGLTYPLVRYSKSYATRLNRADRA